ncbi:AraC family transcriptional regulator [Marivivens niveibacter]|uniref:AraC family transcriptional regulator n=1 Tax=Marivivens niveibacter TaxID=1930667 RepID=UPI000A38B24E|nr:GyrI-like domain-containing protein [Marivivens niveibacter]
MSLRQPRADANVTLLIRVNRVFNISIKEMFPRHLACLKHEEDSAQSDRVAAAEKAISDQDLWRVCGMMVATYDQNSAAGHDLSDQSNVGWLLLDRADVDDPLDVVMLPGGRYAVLRHVGPYGNLTIAYDYLYNEWLDESGETLRNGPTFEMYLNTPEQVAPEELITLIYVPLESA